MEFFSGHDINGDGKNDIYIRHKGQGDPLVVLFMFALIALVIGLSYVSFTLFCYFLSDQKNFPDSVMIMSFAGSFVVVGILIGWFCGQFGRSYSVPFGALGLFFTIGFLWVGVINRDTVSEKNSIEAFERKKEQDKLEFWQKTEAIKNRIKPIQERLTANAGSRGWRIDVSPKIGWGNREGDNYRHWIYWLPASRYASFFITALAPPPLQDLEISVLAIDADAWGNKSSDNWKVTIHGKTMKATNMLTENEGQRFILDRSLENFEPGKFKDLANELAGYLYPLKVAAEKASQELDQEVAVALEAQKQQEAKDRGNELRGWVVVCGAATGSILAIFGLVFFLKRKNKLTALPPTPAPPQDKPAITTAQRYKYTCSGCSARYKLTHDALGKSFPCKKCKITCWVPMDVDQLSIE